MEPVNTSFGERVSADVVKESILTEFILDYPGKPWMQSRVSL